MTNFYKKSIVLLLVLILMLTGCESVSGNMNPLDQDDPVTVTI